MAEGILRARANAAGLDIRVLSAGSMEGGAPATDHAIGVCADRGIDISAHVSRRLERSMIDQADLVIAMTREHLREAVVASPPGFAKTFTLRDLVRRINVDPHASLEELHAGRRIDDYIRPDKDDDVADPVGRPRPVYEATALELDGLLARVVNWLPNLGPARESAASQEGVR
jgi:protein-tyrosine-phosphatase